MTSRIVFPVQFIEPLLSHNVVGSLLGSKSFM